jgi:hypothetical protein
MALAKAPGPAGAELVDAVRNWVHFDNLAETLQKQVTNVRSIRSDYEDRILRMLDSSGMRNAVLQITGATLQRASKPKQSDLSWTFLESNLHDYYKSKGRPDETAAILEFLQTHRTTKTVEYLKKTSTGGKGGAGAGAGAGAPPGTGSA